MNEEEQDMFNDGWSNGAKFVLICTASLLVFVAAGVGIGWLIWH